MNALPSVASLPYHWPFTGAWSMADTAFLCLGVQRDAVRECDATETIARLATLLSAWRWGGGFVVHGRRGYDPAVGLPTPVAWRNDRRTADRILAVGEPGWEIESTLAPNNDEPVIDHSGDNAFLGTDLAFLLDRRGIRNLVIGGLRTEGVVHATMRSANDRGLECLLLEDGTATDIAEAKATILRVTRFGNGLFGVTAPIAAVEAALQRQNQRASVV
jgi:nicotinamidase-related amidase